MKTNESARASERRGGRRREGAGGLTRPLFGLLRWIAEHVRGFYGAVGAFLLIGLGLFVGGIVVFSLIADLVGEGRTQRIDDAILLWMNGHANPTLTAAALEITALAGVAVVWMVLLVSSVFLWTTHHRYSVALLWVSYIGASLINFTIKAMYDRPRPDLFDWRTPMAGHSSFPSGHSTTAVAVFATLAYLIVRLETTRHLRRVTLALALAVVLLIGASRLYLGVHYPSDVVAGFALGLAWATFCALGIEALRYFRGRRPASKTEEEGLETGTRSIGDAVKGSP